MDLLSSLPYSAKESLIKKKQSVRDIMKGLLLSHKEFAADYDNICLKFSGSNTREIANNIFSYLKKNVIYKMEPEIRQTIKSPGAIVRHGFGDCKHYASFAAGVLDALNRKGFNIPWKYRFSSYSLFDSEPEHVFVVIKDNGKEIWLDPTPGADKVKPVWNIDKKIKIKNSMALYKVSGIGNTDFLIEDYYTSPDYLQNPLFYDAIALLLKYGVISKDGNLNDNKISALQKTLSPEDFNKILNARQIITGTVGGFFSSIWRGVKKVTLSIPRAAYLSLLALNFKGWATKFYNALYNADGSYTSFKDKIKKTWQDKLGGDWTKLENTIRNAHNKKAFLSGIGVAPAAPAWVAAATAIIAAMAPILIEALKRKPEVPIYEDPIYNDPMTPQGAGSPGIMDFIKNNPLVIGGGILAVYLLTKKKK